jgi:hypothetical protein
MSLYHGKFIDNGFSLAFYKRMLGKVLTIHDLESLDPEFYNSLLWIRENSLNDNDNLELYFNTSFELLGKIENIELKPGGNDIKLTEENKAEYLELMTNWRFTRGVEEQTKAFLHGFNEVIYFFLSNSCHCIINLDSINIFLMFWSSVTYPEIWRCEQISLRRYRISRGRRGISFRRCGFFPLEMYHLI